MDKYLKIFEPAMKKWLAEHYSPEEAKKRWERTVALDEKWIREEGDLGGRKNAMASNMLEAYAFFAFYDSVDRSFTPEDLQSMIDAAMGKSIRMLSHFKLNKLLKYSHNNNKGDYSLGHGDKRMKRRSYIWHYSPALKAYNGLPKI